MGWGAWLIAEIHKTATEDQARAADAIVVFGAAEYSGRPSPVLHARLDHAVSLYNKQIAPVIITLGGGGDKDSGRSEGGVARDYLLANGVPYDKIIAETRSFDTEQQVARLAVIARANGLQRLVVVSDGTHLFRIRYLCEEQGLDVYTSPRPLYGNISDQDLSRRYFHEMVSYTSLRMHLHASWLRLWLAGKAN
ncbi:YdcF family protein [Granulicella pectinivorans]|uniref:YdcF family protein n=1 Tax=Granulicella pectinivorans TaxID=474950 RepID=UPI001FE67218|nr:YdcF family protein [Granulicella pectinivorans]